MLHKPKGTKKEDKCYKKMSMRAKKIGIINKK